MQGLSMMVVLVMLVLAGCTSGAWWQAKALSGSDTKQAIALEAAQDVKICQAAKGAGSAMGIDGYVERVEARGKNITFQDCLNYMNKTPSSVVLPASRPPVERVLPPE